MNILLVAGGFHDILSKQFEGVINAKVLGVHQVVSFINETHPLADVILITDDGLGRNVRTAVQGVADIAACVDVHSMSSQIVLVTNNFQFMNHSFVPGVNVEFIPGRRISFDEYIKCMKKHFTEKKKEEKKPSHWWNKRITPAVNGKDENSSHVLSHGISRVIAITGHRGSGITSTAANLAQEAHKQGLTAIVVDLDTITCGMNMYYGSHTETDDEEKKNSLIRLLAKPQNYESSAYSIKPGLYMSTLPYDFEDKKLKEQFFTGERLISMLSVLKNKFNICILDLPIEVAAAYKEILLHIDSFGLCINNNLYSVFNTARTLDCYFEREYLNLLVSKSKLIVTNYNDRMVNQGENFSPERVCRVLKTVSPVFELSGECAGYVPRNDEFDMQIETEILVCETNEKMHEAYKKVLIKILEGAD